MIQPNWFDLKYQETMKDMTPEACLSLMASDPKIIAAVKGAFSKVSTALTGPNKTQALRIAICEAMK